MSRVADPKSKIALLRAAEEVFAERGLGGAKVEEIARRAGVSKGAFYLHFESKEAALKQLVESFLARCQSFFAPPPEDAGPPREPWEHLEAALERDVQIFEFLWQNRAFLRIMPTCQGSCDYLVHAFRAETAENTRRWVDHWRRLGIFRENVDADLASTLIGGAYQELSMRLIVAEKRPPFEGWLRFASETFFRAFGNLDTVAAVDARNRRVSLDINDAGRRVTPLHAPRGRRARASQRGST